jgi:endonuclease YncB( thermonuclease family)
MEKKMTSLKKPLIATLAALMLLWPFSLVDADNLFTVTSVYDGDTIGCQGCGIIFRVKLAGIDAPERGTRKRPEQPYAKKARKYLKDLVLGKKVTIKQIGLDRRNFVLAIVYLETSKGFFSSERKNINLEMIKQGYAEVEPVRSGLDIGPYRKAQQTAKKQTLNIWSQKDYISPKVWRKRR